MLHELYSYTNDGNVPQIIAWKTNKKAIEGVCDKLITFIDVNAKTYQIPCGVKTISGWAFCSRGNDIFNATATTLVIPESVEQIEDNALAYCNFTKIKVAEGNYAFKVKGKALYTYDEKRLLFVLDVNKTGEFVVPDGVEEIDSSVFNQTQIIKVLNLPSSVKKFGKWIIDDYRTIKAPKGSQAIKLAKKHGLKYEVI